MADKLEGFTETTNTVARAVNPPCDAGTVRTYADANLIEHIKLANGVRLFRASAAAEVQKLRAQRLARRGGRHAKAPAA